MNKFLNLFLKGIFVGVANIIPGVSGGTIAVVLRIFDQMIDAINNFFKQPKKHIKFLVPLFLGAGVGILIFSKIIEICLAKESLPTSMFFVGLVVGSIPLIIRHAKKKPVKPIYYLASLISFSIVVIISFMKEPTSSSTDIIITIPWLIKIFIYCMIASAAMVVPGISGSFVMVLLGVYNVILTSISKLVPTVIDGISLMSKNSFLEGVKYIVSSSSFITILVGGIGIVLGIILISKLIAFLLEKAFSVTYFSILGLIFGSIFSIFKDNMTYSSYNGNIPILSIILAVIMAIIGFFIAFKLSGEE
ncbi:DUF368 domain-containing protein [uncultured Tyzzerella sp.]|uniref:DUF368 domain-containing protein n=1 Tax=uncultured Tyzzerella sp. TaxID=2321398 RepID=UPI00294210F4|nr:DUF368 domain-containing protein [uncultured Tyzzerella sp.]